MDVVQYTANEVKEVVRSVLIDVGKLRKYDEGGESLDDFFKRIIPVPKEHSVFAILVLKVALLRTGETVKDCWMGMFLVNKALPAALEITMPLLDIPQGQFGRPIPWNDVKRSVFTHPSDIEQLQGDTRDEVYLRQHHLGLTVSETLKKQFDDYYATEKEKKEDAVVFAIEAAPTPSSPPLPKRKRLESRALDGSDSDLD